MPSNNGATSNGATHELNYVTANRFYVEIESTITACFNECSGVGFKLKRESLLEGGVNDQQRIIVGQPEFSDVTLKRGITNDLTFWVWISKILEQSKYQRRNVNILLFNQAGETMQCWTLIGAIPTGWKAPSLQANANSVAIEELTLAYEGLKIDQSGGGGAFYQTSGRDPSGHFSGKA
jgi:phage tail-like protein